VDELALIGAAAAQTAQSLGWDRLIEALGAS